MSFCTAASANLRDSSLDHADFSQADLANADLSGSSLVGANLSGAALNDADLSNSDWRDARWQQIKSINTANIAGLRNAPPGFGAWTQSHGVFQEPLAPGGRRCVGSPGPAPIF